MLPESESHKIQEEENQTKSNKHNIQMLINKHHCKFNLQCDQQLNDQALSQCQRHICQYNLRNDKSIIAHEVTIFLQSSTEQFIEQEKHYYQQNITIIDLIKDYYQVKHQGQIRIKQKIIQMYDQNSKRVHPNNKQFANGVAEVLKHSNYPDNLLNQTKFLEFISAISDIIQNIFSGDQGVAFLFYVPMFALENENIDPVICAVHAYQYSMDFVDESQEGKKQKKDDIKICLISLQQLCQPYTFQKYPDKLQQINLFVQNQQQNQNQNHAPNIYNVNLNNLNIDDQILQLEKNYELTYISKETIYIVFKQFLKKIIKSFDPKVIIFTFKLDVNFMVDPKAFQFLSQKLGRICQSKLIIIPRYIYNFDDFQISFSQQSEEKNSISLQGDLELKCIQQSILQSFRGCLRIDRAFVNAILPTQQQLIYVYQLLKQYFVKTKRDQIYYQNQLKIFKLTQNIKSNKLEKQDIKKKEIQQQSFPLINKLNGITFIDIGEIVIDENTQYFVDYQNCIVLFIDEIKEFATVIEFNQNYVKTCQYNIDLDFTLKQSTYFLDNQILYKFYGIDLNNFWCEDVVAYIYEKNSNNWNKIKFKQVENKDPAKGFITKPEEISKFIQNRIAFSVTKNRLSQKAVPEKKVSLLAVGGHYNNSRIYYQSLFQEFIFDFTQLTYTTKLFRKSQINIFWKECANPFIHTLEQSKILYFEGNGKYSNNSPESKLLELKVIDNNKFPYYLQNNELTSVNINLYRQQSHLFSSKQMNVKNGENGFFQVLLINVEKQKQVVVDESCLENLGKQVIRTFHLFTFQQKQQSKQISIKQETFYEKIGQNLQYDKNQCLHLNWLQNLNNSIFFHFDQNKKQYLLYFRDSDNKKTSKRFRFEHEHEQKGSEPILFPDYEELATVDWIKQQLIIVRRPNVKEINIFTSPFVNLQDVKDTKDDILTVVPMKILKNIPLEESTQLISISIHEQFIFIITTTLLIKFACDLKHIDKTIETFKINQIPCNTYINTTPFKFLYGLLGFFYQEGMANYFYKTQNAIVFKYFYQDGEKSDDNKLIFKEGYLTFIPGITLTPDAEASITSIISENQFEILIQVTVKIKSNLHYYQLRCDFQTKIQIRRQDEIQILEGVKPFKSLVGNQSKDFIAYLDLNYERCGL